MICEDEEEDYLKERRSEEEEDRLQQGKRTNYPTGAEPPQCGQLIWIKQFYIHAASSLSQAASHLITAAFFPDAHRKI